MLFLLLACTMSAVSSLPRGRGKAGGKTDGATATPGANAGGTLEAKYLSKLTSPPKIGVESTDPWVLDQPDKGRRIEIRDNDGSLLRAVENLESNEYNRGPKNIPGLDMVGSGFNVYTGDTCFPLFAWTMPTYPQGDSPTNAAKDSNAQAYTKWLIPLELQVKTVSRTEQSSSTEVFSSSDSYFKSSAMSLGISVIPPFVTAALSLSRKRTKMTKLFSKYKMAQTSQKHTLFELAVEPTIVRKCEDGLGCTDLAASDIFTPAFKQAIDALPDFIFLSARRLQGDAEKNPNFLPEEAFKKDNFTHFCYRDGKKNTLTAQAVVTSIDAMKKGAKAPRLFSSGMLKVFCLPLNGAKRLETGYKDEGGKDPLQVETDTTPGDLYGSRKGLLVGGKDVTEAISNFARDQYAYRRFLWTYGTHYIQEAGFGGELHVKSTTNKQSQVDEETFTQAAKLEIKASFKAEKDHKTNTTIGVDYGYKEEETSSSESGSDELHTTLSASGGDLSLASGGPEVSRNAWIKSIMGNPVLVNQELRPITELIMPVYDPRCSDIDGLGKPFRCGDGLALTSDTGSVCKSTTCTETECCVEAKSDTQTENPNGEQTSRFRSSLEAGSIIGRGKRQPLKATSMASLAAASTASAFANVAFPGMVGSLDLELLQMAGPGEIETGNMPDVDKTQLGFKKLPRKKSMQRWFMEMESTAMGTYAQVLKTLGTWLQLKGAKVSAMNGDDQKTSQYEECKQLSAATDFYRDIWAVMTGLERDFCSMGAVTCKKGVATNGLEVELDNAQARKQVRALHHKSTVKVQEARAAVAKIIDQRGERCQGSQGSCGIMNPRDTQYLAFSGSEDMPLQCVTTGMSGGEKEGKKCLATYSDESSEKDRGGEKGEKIADVDGKTKNHGAIKLGGKCFATEECRFAKDATVATEALEYNPTEVPKQRCMRCEKEKCTQTTGPAAQWGCAWNDIRWKDDW